MRQRFAFALLAFALASAAALPAQAQASFTTYVAVGDSLAAGFSNGSLVVTHQRNSVPALIARQAGASDFQQPTVAEPGIPPELALLTLLPSPQIAPKAATNGAPTNLTLARPYNNLAVPGATSIDALQTVTDGGGMHDLILRKLGTQVQQASALHPSFITLWIGNNDVLGAAVNGVAVDGVTLTPPSVFRQTYGAIVSQLKATGAPIVAANLPDVTSIPFVTTIPPVVVDPSTREPVLVNGLPVPLIGPTGPVPSGSLITLGASSLLAKGVGIPKQLGGQGTPLPNEVILDPAEQQTIRDHVTADNQAIADVCNAAGVPVLDIHGLLQDIAANGRTIGGITVNADFLTGGVFGYDGVHPTDLGYAIVANEWIQTINQKAGASLPLVDLTPFLGVASSSRRAAAAAEFSEEAWDALRAVFPPLDRN